GGEEETKEEGKVGDGDDHAGTYPNPAEPAGAREIRGADAARAYPFPGDGIAARPADDAALFQGRSLPRHRPLGRPQTDTGDRSEARRRPPPRCLRHRPRQGLLGESPKSSEGPHAQRELQEWGCRTAGCEGAVYGHRPTK